MLFKMANLYLMCGLPGAGKSTFLKTHVLPSNTPRVIISRDEIRYSLLKEQDEYFSKEKEVSSIFWERINRALSEGKTVFADQTSLTPKSREWFVQHVSGYTHIYLIWIDTDLTTCLKRNENRKNTRAYVPRGQIRRMFRQFIKPSLSEGFDDIFHFVYKNDRLDLEEGADFSTEFIC